jgi:hypothetical protein
MKQWQESKRKETEKTTEKSKSKTNLKDAHVVE